MTDAVAAAKGEVQRVVGDLEALRDRLAGAIERLPAGSGESDPEADLDEMGEVTELRSVIECVLHDFLRPSIEDLRTVAGPEPE